MHRRAPLANRNGDGFSNAWLNPARSSGQVPFFTCQLDDAYRVGYFEGDADEGMQPKGTGSGLLYTPVPVQVILGPFPDADLQDCLSQRGS